MTLAEIKTAIANGQSVHWASLLYEVVKDKYDQYFIICKTNNHAIGLTWADGITLNGKEGEFFTNCLIRPTRPTLNFKLSKS